MKVITGRNVNEIFPLAIWGLNHDIGSQIVLARDEQTIEFSTPVCSVYLKPTERVLFDSIRDANPFFHFMESLWILAGRKDVAWISRFNSRISQYSDDGETFHGAYGDRMRHVKRRGADDIDQIHEVINILRKEPSTRRAVLQIWDAGRDLTSQDNKKDLPCNDVIMLKIRNGHLNMTVCNRSNDLIWGCYGANVVHFSMLQEYIAAMVGVEVGVYTQMSDSLHVYSSNPQWQELKDLNPATALDPYKSGEVSPYPLKQEEDTMFNWNSDLDHFMNDPYDLGHKYRHAFFTEVALPMLRVWDAHKTNRDGLGMCNDIQAIDWRKACYQWLARREERYA